MSVCCRILAVSPTVLLHRFFALGERGRGGRGSGRRAIKLPPRVKKCFVAATGRRKKCPVAATEDNKKAPGGLKGCGGNNCILIFFFVMSENVRTFAAERCRPVTPH